MEWVNNTQRDFGLKVRIGISFQARTTSPPTQAHLLYFMHPFSIQDLYPLLSHHIIKKLNSLINPIPNLNDATNIMWLCRRVARRGGTTVRREQFVIKRLFEKPQLYHKSSISLFSRSLGSQIFNLLPCYSSSRMIFFFLN